MEFEQYKTDRELITKEVHIRGLLASFYMVSLDEVKEFINLVGVTNECC